MKFVNITYGLKGDSEQYTYLVNDNVKVGQVIFPAFKHKPDGKITSTVGIVQTTNKVTSKMGITMAQMMNDKGIVANYIATNSREMNNKIERDMSSGKFVGGSGYAKTERNDEGIYVSTNPENYENKTDNRREQMQQLNADLVRTQEISKPESYDDYVSQYFDINARKRG